MVNLNGVVAWDEGRWSQPRWGWGLMARFTPGSSCLATRGFETESLWDSLLVPEHPGQSRCRGRGGHPGRGGSPHEIILRRCQAAGLVDEVAAGALQFQGFGGKGDGGFNGAGVFLAQCLNPHCSQRQFLTSDAFHFAHSGVGIEVGHGERFVAGLFNGVFHP